MKAISLKVLVSLFTAFAAYYAYFLYTIFDDLFFSAPNEFCGTGDVWALEGGAVVFAPIALVGCAALWFVGRQRRTIGSRFARTGWVTVVILAICAAANLLIFVPSLIR